MARYMEFIIGSGAATLTIAVLLTSGSFTDAKADHVASSESIGPMHGARIVIPLMNPDRGKKLFMSKGVRRVSRDQRHRWT